MFSLPVLIVSTICEFFSTFEPPTLPWLITQSSATVSELCVTALYPSPSLLSALIASSFVIPTTAGTSTISDELLLAELTVVASTEVLLLFAVFLPFPTSLITTNIVIISIITAIPIPMHFITSSSLSFLSSSISSSLSESFSRSSSSVSSLSSSKSCPAFSVRSSSSSGLYSSSSFFNTLSYAEPILTKSSSGITSDFLRSTISSAAD